MGDKKNPALIELIIMIFFFSLSATIIVQLFVTSYQISRRSQRSSAAVIMSQDIIEQLKADPISPEKVLKNWENTKDQDGAVFTAYLDEHMNSAAKEESEYKFVIQLQNIRKDSGMLVEIHMSVYDNTADDSIIFQLVASRYISSAAEDTV